MHLLAIVPLLALAAAQETTPPPTLTNPIPTTRTRNTFTPTGSCNSAVLSIISAGPKPAPELSSFALSYARTASSYPDLRCATSLESIIPSSLKPAWSSYTSAESSYLSAKSAEIASITASCTSLMWDVTGSCRHHGANKTKTAGGPSVITSTSTSTARGTGSSTPAPAASTKAAGSGSEKAAVVGTGLMGALVFFGLVFLL
jgi:hypothetical protein